ncbi:MAG: hypothetical protein GOV02_02125 [Candidatus Aenigmarchaeota archaeon]|nr:hypothetical protein [Candidatus Aenigmarchaeota archaeon]
MTEVDFAIAIGITIAIISFIIFYAVGDFTENIGMIRADQLDSAKVSLSNQILKDYLSDDVKKIEMMFEEIGNSSHSESLKISLEPGDVADDIYIYDDEFNEKSTSIDEYSENVTVVFSVSFSEYEKEYLSLFYRGNSTTKINYETNVIQKNITGIIISESSVPVVSYEKCSDMMSMSFDDFKDELKTDHYFQLQLTGCNFGPAPPDTDVVVHRVSVLREDSDGSIVPDVAVLRVWL